MAAGVYTDGAFVRVTGQPVCIRTGAFVRVTVGVQLHANKQRCRVISALLITDNTGLLVCDMSLVEMSWVNFL